MVCLKEWPSKERCYTMMFVFVCVLCRGVGVGGQRKSSFSAGRPWLRQRSPSTSSEDVMVNFCFYLTAVVDQLQPLWIGQEAEDLMVYWGPCLRKLEMCAQLIEYMTTSQISILIGTNVEMWNQQILKFILANLFFWRQLCYWSCSYTAWCYRVHRLQLSELMLMKGMKGEGGGGVVRFPPFLSHSFTPL